MRPGRIRDRVHVGAGDVERGPVRAKLRDGRIRSLDDHDRMRRVELSQPLVRAHEPVGADPVLAAEDVARFVDALVGAERRVALEPVDDLGELPRPRRRSLRQVRQFTEPEPTEQPVLGGRVEQRPLGGDRLRVPARRARPDEVDPRRGDLGQPVSSVRRLAPRRRPIREDEREDAPAVDEQDPGCRVDPDDAHRRRLGGAADPAAGALAPLVREAPRQQRDAGPARLEAGRDEGRVPRPEQAADCRRRRMGLAGAAPFLRAPAPRRAGARARGASASAPPSPAGRSRALAPCAPRPVGVGAALPLRRRRSRSRRRFARSSPTDGCRPRAATRRRSASRDAGGARARTRR